MATVSPSGLNQNFRTAMGEIETRTRKMVEEATIGIAAYASTMTPVMTSNLINSQYRNVQVSGGEVVGTVGYGAKYAIYAHEAPGTLLNASVLRRPGEPRWGYVWDPNGQPGFLKKGAEEYRRQDLNSAIKRVMGV